MPSANVEPRCHCFKIGIFKSANITYGNLTASYLEFNVSAIEPNKQMTFFYNITSYTIADALVPPALMSYYDNWIDLQEDLQTESILVNFVSGEPTHNPHLPYWDIGNQIPTVWGWIILTVAPAVVALVSVFILYFKRR